MKILIDIEDGDFDELWNLACRNGYLRTEPTKRWTQDEKKNAVRWFLIRRAKGFANFERVRFG